MFTVHIYPTECTYWVIKQIDCTAVSCFLYCYTNTNVHVHATQCTGTWQIRAFNSDYLQFTCKAWT